jgi:hypothetical protein
MTNCPQNQGTTGDTITYRDQAKSPWSDGQQKNADSARPAIAPDGRVDYVPLAAVGRSGLAVMTAVPFLLATKRNPTVVCLPRSPSLPDSSWSAP